ncbi:MAG: SRPBCC domain-containing protein [Vicinamibacteria bacterium]
MKPRVLPGDQARASVLVAATPEEAFRVFTEEINLWWRAGVRYRSGGAGRSVLHLEARDGGRLFESFDVEGETRVMETGRILVCDPPRLLVIEWRASNFSSEEKTEVEVSFEAKPGGTFVTVCHRGWAAIRPDHPVRHRQDVAAFVRMMGLWWGDLLTSLRLRVGEGR